MEKTTGLRALSFTSLLFAALQNICVAVLTVSGIRVAIGLTALTAGMIYEPVHSFHQDAIRIPMLIIAVAGAVLNLLVLAWIWYLRSRPSAQWRRLELSAKQKRSERLQVALSVVTLLLVFVEVYAHAWLHHQHALAAAHSVAFLLR